jgi:hypothetical protein
VELLIAIWEADKIDLFGASPYIDALAIPYRTIHNDSQSRNALAVGVW